MLTRSLGLSIPGRIQQGTLLNQLPLTDLKQYLLKSGIAIPSNALGTKMLDSSPLLTDANIYQPCLYPTADYQFMTDTPIVVDWKTDGVKLEFIASLAVGKTISYIATVNSTPNTGVLIQTGGLRVVVYKADNVTATSKVFANITTLADDVFYRYRVEISGNNMICKKTAVADVDFANATSQTIDITGAGYDTSSFNSLRPMGGLCYLNIAGTKFAFSEGEFSRYIYSYNTAVRFNTPTAGQLAKLQNVYCHNAKYGYSRGYIEISTSREYINLAYQENGTPATSLHTSFFTKFVFEEYPATKSFGYGYAIKLDDTLLAFDQGNTFFDVSNVAKAVYKKDIPSKLNNRVFYNHKLNKDLVVYGADKTINLPINTANKKVIIEGDSMASTSYWWNIILAQLTGFVNTVKSFSGHTLSTQLKTVLEGQVAVTPTLISDKDYIIICGAFNDYAQNVSVAVFTSGLTELLAYNRAQNAIAKIIVCAPYNWGNPIDSGATENAGGMSRDEMRAIMQAVTLSNSNSVFINWNDANIVQSDISDNLHLSCLPAAYRIAKLIYDRILTINQ